MAALAAGQFKFVRIVGPASRLGFLERQIGLAGLAPDDMERLAGDGIRHFYTLLNTRKSKGLGLAFRVIWRYF
jgi:hypothetical protein